MNPLTQNKINERKTCNMVYEKSDVIQSNPTNETIHKPIETCSQSSNKNIIEDEKSSVIQSNPTNKTGGIDI